MIKEFESKQAKAESSIPELRGGYTVRVSQKIREGDKERIQAFEGIVIKVGAGAGINKTVTIRKVVDGVGVEKIFPLHSPNVVKIDVIRKSHVRRAKLYYMRGNDGRGVRLYEEKEAATAAVKKAK